MAGVIIRASGGSRLDSTAHASSRGPCSCGGSLAISTNSVIAVSRAASCTGMAPGIIARHFVDGQVARPDVPGRTINLLPERLGGTGGTNHLERLEPPRPLAADREKEERLPFVILDQLLE